MSEPSLLPPSASDFMRCVERGTSRLSALPVSVNQLWDPDTCPVALLPYLAWALSVDRWDRDWTEETKRQVIRDAWAIHRHKGTISAIRRVVEPFGYVINVTEWWQNGDPRGTFRIDIGVQNAGITEETYSELTRLIDDARPVSRHLASLNIMLDAQGVARVFSGMHDGSETTIWPAASAGVETVSVFRASPAFFDGDMLTIYPPTPSVSVDAGIAMGLRVTGDDAVTVEPQAVMQITTTTGTLTASVVFLEDSLRIFS
ncbi:phage tail protein I [Escherichia coli]|nr:phage tail protein I [Escherichia coli]HBB8937011.1 phage tail protein I [Escherichia coli]HBC6373522.1 phage tail protein I [Escherichia coli]